MHIDVSTKMSTHMTTYMYMHMSTHMSTHMSAHMSTHMSTHVSTCMSTHIHTCLHTSTHMFLRKLAADDDKEKLEHADLANEDETRATRDEVDVISHTRGYAFKLGWRGCVKPSNIREMHEA